jgi:hypothetical protein
MWALMKNLLILVCARDVEICHRLILRIGRLGGLSLFQTLFLHADHDVELRALDPILHLAQDAGVRVEILRLAQEGAWRTRRAETMLRVYQTVCADRLDIVRMDPDIYISDGRFFAAIGGAVDGIAGKLMRFHLPAEVNGRQLDFIQGGVTLWGASGRAYLETLKSSQIEDFRNNYTDVATGLVPERSDEYEQYFRSNEDLVLTGILAIMAAIQRTNIAGLQVSPYDVLMNHRSDKWRYEDFTRAFEESGALAYHFEGGRSGRRALMTEMLVRYYGEHDASGNLGDGFGGMPVG